MTTRWENLHPLEAYVIGTRRCGYCGAEPGGRCMVLGRSRGLAQWTHERRYGDLRVVYNLGYHEGEDNALEWEHASHSDPDEPVCWYDRRKRALERARERAAS